MTAFTVRIATAKDASEVTAVFRASFPVLMASAYDAAALKLALPMMTQADPVLLSSGTYFVGETKQSLIIGCGGWSHEQPGKAGTIIENLGHIRHFATHPVWIGQGVGSAIIATCKRSARDAGITRFECFSSLNAETFYAGQGFVRVENRDVPLGGVAAIESVLMTCAL